MSRKVYIEITTLVVLNIDEGIETKDVVDTMDITVSHTRVSVEDVEIGDFKIIDSK